MFILRRQDRAAAVLVAAAGLSDLLDGWLARRTGASPLGLHLDPLADKLLANSALLALAARGNIPWWPVALLTLRDALVTILRLTGGASSPSTAARLKTGLLYASITLLLRSGSGPAARAGRAGLNAAVALALLSAVDYLRRR